MFNEKIRRVKQTRDEHQDGIARMVHDARESRIKAARHVWLGRAETATPPGDTGSWIAHRICEANAARASLSGSPRSGLASRSLRFSIGRRTS